VLPANAIRSGFEFRYPDLASALQQIYEGGRG
jgi:NAD dependent epimerase/dehydratase family enzyme